MAKIDSYLRSIEKFGAVGAVLTSGQAVTLRFPTGDRHATQVTPHELLVGLVQEVAPPAVLDLINKSRPARFEIDSNGNRYAISVASRPGLWQVSIEAVAAPAAPAPAARGSGAGVAAQTVSGYESQSGAQFATQPNISAQRTSRPGQPTPPAPAQAIGELTIERGQYDAGPVAEAVAASASAFLDQITHAARAAQATDIFLTSGSRALQRGAGEPATEVAGMPVDGDQLARELGVVAPAEARAAWTDKGAATFSYSDGAGWIRVQLGRDRSGPTASLRLLPEGAPELGQIGLNGAEKWLNAGGLVLVTGPAGCGKTLTLAALVRAAADRGRRVVSIEAPIEVAHASPWISQRGVGPHVESVAAGIHAAMREGVDAIAVGALHTAADAGAVVDAVAADHLVLVTVVAPVAQMALERLVGEVVADRREVARSLLESSWLASLRPMLGRNGRTFEIVTRDGR